MLHVLGVCTCVCVRVWVSVLVISEEEEHIGGDIMRKGRVFLKRTQFSGSWAMLLEGDSLIKGCDLVHTLPLLQGKDLSQVPMDFGAHPCENG